MIRKVLLTVLLLLPLLAISGMAHASAISSDKRYWSNAARSMEKKMPPPQSLSGEFRLDCIVF